MTLPAIHPVDIDQELLFQSILEGDSFVKASKKVGINPSTLLKMVNEDPLFKKKIQDSRVIWTDDLVCSLIGITAGCTTMPEVSAAKVESENIKWAASKFVPETFGESLNLNVNHHLDLSSVLLAAEGRVLPILATKSMKPPYIDAATKNSDAYTPRGEAIIDAEVVQHGENKVSDAFKQSIEVAEGFTDIPDELKGLV